MSTPFGNTRSTAACVALGSVVTLVGTGLAFQRVRWADSLAVAVVGIGFTVLTTGLFAAMELSRRRAIGLAEQKTADARASEILMREAKDLAERASEARSEFLSRMSHELRTPLTAILGFTELLQIGDVSVDQQRKFIDRTHKAGEHLLLLVNDVLDISRVESGTLTVSIEPAALSTVMDEVLALLGPLAASREITIDNRISRHVVVRADRNRLRQILLNLVSNAINFNRDDGSVTLESTLDDGNVLITVTDTGRGIAGEDLPRLFQPFERLGIQTGEIEGTGIGLALSKALTEQMGGSITAASELGHGSQFTVRVPHATLVSPGAPPTGALHDAKTTNDTERVAKVLYIEDNASNTVLIESALALRPGIQLLCADKGGLGLEAARLHMPDVVLLDLHLPDMPGQEVLSKLQADADTANIPVVVISADATPRRIAALIEAGAFAYITKPMVIRDFLDVVDEALASPNVTT